MTVTAIFEMYKTDILVAGPYVWSSRVVLGTGHNKTTFCTRNKLGLSVGYEIFSSLEISRVWNAEIL